MKQLRRVVWSEGMYLAPQHFQTQSRYLEDSIDFATSALWFRPYGVAACEMDGEALRNGTAAVLHAKGVMPDGLPFHIPESDGAPPARPIGEVFSPTRDAHLLMLALPERRDGVPNFSNDGAASGAVSGTRYRAGTQLQIDETTGTEERVVEVGQKNFRLVLDTEAGPGTVAMPVARILRSGGGHFIFDPQYIPPCLDISASPRLIGMLRELVGLLEEKSVAMGGRQRGSGQAPADYWRRDLGSFWFLHTIHSSLGLLRHLLLSRQGHPEQLYREMARLGGALCSFALDAHPRDLPLYDHDRLSECFAALDTHIRRHLELIVPTNVTTVAFQAAESYFWTAAIHDARLLDRTRWILEIQSREAGEAALIARTPQLVKLCSDKFVRELVRRAVPGLTLTHLPAPPPAVPTRVEAQYFGITKKGPCWDHIVASRQVGIYVPGDFPKPRVSLIILTEE